MQQPSDNTQRMLLATEEELFSLMIPTDHAFRRSNTIIDFNTLVLPLRSLSSELGSTGIDIQKGFKALLVQFWEDYSDRQMESAIRENIAVRWFCGFSIQESTPDHSYFGKLRDRIGAKRLADIFKEINTMPTYPSTRLINKRNGVQRAIPTSGLARKTSKAVDMRFGLIRKTALTAANILDPDVMKSVCPNQGMVFTDKLYDRKSVDNALKAKGCHPATIRKNNNKRKNRDLDRWRSKVRMPFEGVFSKMEKRARYRGLVKNVFQNFFEAITHNLKKAVTILPRSPVMIAS